MQLILLSTDLMTMSVAQGAADRHGVPLKVVPSARAALDSCDGESAGLLAVDLRTPGIDVATLVSELRASSGPSIRVMAFGPHVHEASLAAAVAAGCDEVVTRGEFDRRLDAAMSRLGTA